MFPITMNAVAKRILEARQMERGVRGREKTDADTSNRWMLLVFRL